MYSKRLLKGITELKLADNFILLCSANNSNYIEQLFPSFEIISLKTEKIEKTHKLTVIRRFLYKNQLDKIIQSRNISLLFTPYLYIGSLSTSVIPQVGVLHDAQWYSFQKSEGLKGFILRYFFLGLLLLQKEIVTISEYSKNSIAKEIPNLKTHLEVIYNCIEPALPVPNSLVDIPKPYILYVNTLMPYKNLETLIKAFIKIKDEIDHDLVIKGKWHFYWDDTIKPIIEEYNISHRIHFITENFSEEQMANLYKQASLFVSTSLYEGFGYTPIEASVYRTPVISTKESALFETTRGLLNYYEPAKDHSALARLIKHLLCNKPSSEELERISETYNEVYSTRRQATNFIKFFNKLH